ncbi:Phage lysin N-acetylmuramoyl-L-alanine amidase [Lactococcus lactis subsp. lactis]|uniref:Phage lysin N-acetylmuramoyl-L-alanine amidase n=2 Tax=Lactococcus lactis TaxID=1358 RepID=A0A0V8DSQ2_LACLL|nr:Phage lysin N-acetylmuramoyl-L-alanine amidase [Lactococcus lactis subsp. lactis]
MTYLIFAKDTKRWYITNGIEIRYIKTTRVLGNYQNQWLKFNLPVDTMFQGEVDKEFGTGATNPNRDISKG